ncbi:putative periplasmic sensor histidine kinase [endosymbiont of Acanthamoeba sp. UWC8]|uniref:sodium:solute symporter family transporter n=1 Tax=endosymbiont of Acanthamoeba sp. UWC8 TaxID=86106 RepID=UPI0004D14666|nr:ATP-binding protein [endosymbiont of Acanthamoeba sp. UWC8]AIF81401.1 putative periplasmic sensor histidine kinase [endosymbiont of Acanthamoeba sp. UWC8]
MLKLSYIDLFIVITFLVICLIIGLYKSVKIKTLKDFAVGYKNISVTVLVCTIFASSVGASSTIGITSKIYEFGAVFIVLQLLIPVYWLITAKIVTRNIDQFKDCISMGEIMYKLYGMPGRWMLALAATARSLGSLTAQALAMGYVFYYFLGIETGYGILIGYGIITIYAALGGIRAVIHTETFKFNIFFFIIPISYIVIFTRTGGLENLISHLPESYLHLKLSNENIKFLSSFIIYLLLPGVYPDFIQRCLMARNAEQLKRALNMTALISLPFSAAICLIAYKMRADFPNINPNDALLHFVGILPPILKGTMVAGLLAIIMSVAEATINASSIILVNDVLKVLYPKISNTLQLIALRGITIILSFASLCIINLSHDILQLEWLVGNFWEPIISIPAIAGFLGLKTNSKSFIASVIMAMAFIIIGRFIVGEFTVIIMSFGIIGSAIGLFGMHYYQIFTGQVKLQQSLQKPKNTISHNIALSLASNLYKSFRSSINLLTYNPGQHNLKIRQFCIYTLTYYFTYSLHLTSNPDHEVFAYLIAIGYFFCMVLLFRESLFSKNFINKYLHYYWYFLLAFCLPFVSSYMLFVSKGDDFWVINGILSAFSLYLFVDARRFILLYSIGLIFGFILFKLTGHSIESFEEITTASSIAYIYLFFTTITLLFFRKKEKEQDERVETMHMFGGAMAHEVKSPLATMDMYAGHLGSLLEEATNNKQKQGDFYLLKIKETELEMILDAGKTLKKISSHGITTVDTLLASMKSSVISDDKKELFMNEFIDLAISEYELLKQKQDGIKIIIIDNFQFYGSMYFMKQMLFNLLNNSYKYGGRNVKINIRAENNKLYFRDDGKGIAEEDIPYIFDKFYTKSKSGTGIGLAFCKMVMQDLGGYIECKSRLGKYTEFILTFPKAKKIRKLTKKQ